MRGADHNLGVVVEVSTFKTYPNKGGMHYNADMVFTDDSIDGVLQTTKNVIKTGLDCSIFFFFFEGASPHVIASAPDEATAYPHRGKMITNAIIQVTRGDESLNQVADVGAGNRRQKPLTMPHEEL
ncbi:hypothetical protein B0T13DRAFT_512657 [Neurospora crassa]|nr:hypothetical protein B0T13DRAFT_512657 [Neurospora crassa]